LQASAVLHVGQISRFGRTLGAKEQMVFDQATLFTVTISITGLLGVFLLVLWLQERSVRTLAWWGGAYLMGACAVTLWGQHDRFAFITPEMPNAFLFIACGMIWNGARLFQGRVVLPGGLFAGAVLWFLAMQFESFAASDNARTVLSSVVIALYAFLTAFELRRERRRDMARRWLWIAVPMLHAAVFLAPAVLIAFLPEAASPGSLFALFAFETVIYVVGTAFVIVVMAKERVAQFHKTAAMTDMLTGLYNRRAFLDAANLIIADCAKKNRPVSVLLFDLDHFKSINDRFGHAVGDDALKLFAATATSKMRATDVIGRLGGEEFAAIVPGGEMEAGLVAERLRQAFEAAGVAISGYDIAATVSVGVATALVPMPIEPLLARADAALYAAKRNGRNRIEFDDGKAPQAQPARPAAASPELIPAFGQPVAALQ
jgi:diguanylate cyclase (GGDEF)-like protein